MEQESQNLTEEASGKRRGSFVSSVLLDAAEFDMARFARDLREDWQIDAGEEVGRGEPLAFDLEGGMLAAISLVPSPIPGDGVVEDVKANFRWPGAAAAVQAHRARLMISVIPHGPPLTEAGIVLVKLSATALSQPHAVGIHTLGTVLAPEFYVKSAQGYLEEDLFPVLNLVFFGLYSNDGGKTACGYTSGMRAFGKEELEIIDSARPADELVKLLIPMASYVIEEDVTLRDGETVGFTEEQKLPLVLSAGCAIDGLTLKIGF